MNRRLLLWSNIANLFATILFLPFHCLVICIIGSPRRYSTSTISTSCNPTPLVELVGSISLTNPSTVSVRSGLVLRPVRVGADLEHPPTAAHPHIPDAANSTHHPVSGRGWVRVGVVSVRMSDDSN